MPFVRNIFFKILYRIGILKTLLLSNRNKGKFPVLVFHKIIPEYDEIWPGVHPLLFEEIILLLKKHYIILPLDKLLTGTKEELKNACFITFDDGYRDYLDYAYPILSRHNVPSAIFVLPYQISNKGHIWTSAVTFFIKHYSFAEINSYFTRLGLKINTKDPYNYFGLNLEITRQLCKMKSHDRLKIVNELRAKFVADNRIIENELLSFNELRSIDPNLTYIGSHSLTHPSFQVETDEGFIHYEMRLSKEIIESELKTKSDAFAFPFANWNTSSLNCAKKYFRICFTGLNKMVEINKIKSSPDELYNLHRFNVHHNSAEEVLFLINGFHSFFKK